VAYQAGCDRHLGTGLRTSGQNFDHRNHWLDSDCRQRVANSARSIPIVFAPNFSVGVNALFGSRARPSRFSALNSTSKW
jgi:hypothetical protein